MNKTRKPFLRWVGEALLIFLSVLGAFYFDNLRDERNQRKLYVQHLGDFRDDLMGNQGKFNFELASRYDQNTSEGYLNERIRQLSVFDSLLDSPPAQSEAQLITMINDQAIIGLTQWIFTSPQYDKLSREYYSFIKNDSLRDMLEIHYRNNASRHNYKEAINGQISNFQLIEDQLDLDNPYDRQNRPILFSNESKNKVRRIKSTYEALRRFTRLTKSNDSLLLIQVKKELGNWSTD